MSSMEKIIQTNLQSKVFDFALSELICQQRNTFHPLWTVDSWVKFLIWMTLNCGLSGERESLELFAQALGNPLTVRMRKLFFERILDHYSLKILADPAEEYVFLIPMDNKSSLDFALAKKALDELELMPMVQNDLDLWQQNDSLLLIPWSSKPTGK